jgi:thiol-disulfide isomerase/thioredoxin
MIRTLAALAFLLLAGLASAAGTPFEQAPFDAARQAGKPVVVMVYAEWCPTCRKQDPAVEAVLKSPEFAKFALFRVDFDMQDEVLEALRVTRQSTLIVYKGDKEVARSTGETRPDAIAAQFRKAL